MNFRTGIGYDVHRFLSGRKLMLGGVEIPHDKGLDGHSDADVVVHAVCDALLGAVGCGDIGEHFPPSDVQYTGISSLILLKKVHHLIDEAGYRVVNVDVAILAEEPHLKAFKPAMRVNIAGQLDVDESCVNIKATTNEGMGFIGNKEGIAAYAAALVVNK